MKKKTNKKVASALAMLMLSAAMLGTSTYAWFTMNKTVTVTGMEVKTKVGSNLLIAPDSYDLSTTNDNVESKYVTDIKQVRMCLLEPTSTINGVNYFYTVEASADGQKLDGKQWKSYSEADAVANDVAGKTAYSKQFNIDYTTGTDSGFDSSSIKMNPTASPAVDGAAYGYVDYTFYIKATSDKAAQNVVMTKCNLQNNGAALTTSGTIPNVDRAWRVAVFSQAASMATDNDSAAAAGNLVTILKLQNAENHTSGKAVDSATSVATIPDADKKAVIGTITSAGTTSYYRVTVRLWLEGEDKTCTSETYAKLTSMYSLDLEFKLEDSDTNAVNSIGSVAGWYGALHSGSGN